MNHLSTNVSISSGRATRRMGLLLLVGLLAVAGCASRQPATPRPAFKEIAVIPVVSPESVYTETLTNRGLIDGRDTQINAGALVNDVTGRIYGDHLSIAAGSVLNEGDGTRGGTIAARERLDIGANTVVNREHALIFSGNEMAIGKTLDANRQAVGQATLIHNASATIESLGDMRLSAATIRNSNERLASQAAVAVINNRGNLGDALHDLGSSENIKGLVTAIITGGVLQGLNMNPTGQPTVSGGAQRFIDQLGQNLQAGTAKAVIGTAINGGSFEDNLKNSLKSAILDTAAAQTAFAIGDLKEVGALDRFTQGFAHAVTGCAIGALTADSGSACGAGALGAAVGGIAAQAYGSKADTVQFAAFLGGLAAAAAGGDAALIDLAGQAAANAVANNHQAHPGWGYEYPEVDHPFAPTDEFKARFFGSEAERAVWFRTQEIAAGTAQTREWLQFDDPKVQLPRSGGPLYQIFDLGGNSAGAVRIAYSPRNPSVFYVSLDHYGATSAQPLRWTRFEATSK